MTFEEAKSKLDIFRSDEFKFDEGLHEYRFRGKKLQSVTGWIKNFNRPFDAKKWTEKKAIDYGVSTEEVAKGWEILAESGMDLGHDVHKFIELFLNNENPALPDDETQRKRVLAWLDYYNTKLYKMKLLGQEIRVWSERYGLAGTIDALFWWKDQIVVGDWKTNKKMKTDADKHYAMMLYPFEDEKENTINTYSLQVSTYQAILRDNGIISDKAFICWISPNGEIKSYQSKNFVDKIDNYLMSFPVKNG